MYNMSDLLKVDYESDLPEDVNVKAEEIAKRAKDNKALKNIQSVKKHKQYAEVLIRDFVKRDGIVIGQLNFMRGVYVNGKMYSYDTDRNGQLIVTMILKIKNSLVSTARKSGNSYLKESENE